MYKRTEDGAILKTSSRKAEREGKERMRKEVGDAG